LIENELKFIKNGGKSDQKWEKFAKIGQSLAKIGQKIGPNLAKIGQKKIRNRQKIKKIKNKKKKTTDTATQPIPLPHQHITTQNDRNDTAHPMVPLSSCHCHSLTSHSHKPVPVYPPWHEQLNPPKLSLQVASGEQLSRPYLGKIMHFYM
jgi:hypothetical protein